MGFFCLREMKFGLGEIVFEMKKLWKIFYEVNIIFVFQVFQCFRIEGENVGEDVLREVERFFISDEEFEGFLYRYKEVFCLVFEFNQKVV